MRTLVRTFLSLSVLHWLTSIGVVLTTASAVMFLVLVFQPVDNPYFGIVVFLVIPSLFVLGLILMPSGVWLAARRAGGYGRLWSQVPADPSRAARLAWAFAFATLANAGIIGAASYQSISYMDSKQFCGQTCHPVMEPQRARHQRSPHASVDCVNCHIGPGASSFFQYKLAGVRQLVALATKRYERPIPPAKTTMRPANEICEECHFAGRVRDDRIKVIRHYDDDEASTEKTTVLLMRTGRIHMAHVGRDIEYVSADAAAQMITSVTVDGKTYAVEGGAPAGRRRKMDCIDCHNRVGHDFEMPETAVDRAITDERLDRSRPFARREAIAMLKSGSPAPEIRGIYSENVFSSMNITWGTYPNNIGHDKFPGCFRCHGGEHVTKSGDAITRDCAACHEPVAVDEQNPEILTKLGVQ